MQILSTKVFYFEKYFENTILFCIFKILFRSILHITAMGATHPAPWIRHCYISEMVEDRWVHAARRLTSIELSFDPCNIYCDGPRGVGYPADARSVGDSHPSYLSGHSVECTHAVLLLSVSPPSECEWNANVVRNKVLLCSVIDPVTLTFQPLTFNPKTLPEYSKFEHFGIIRFWVMLQTNC